VLESLFGITQTSTYFLSSFVLILCICRYSWVPSTFSGQGEACPWDSNLQKKSAFDGIVAGLNSQG
jgi:hypothetical protein